MWATFEINDRFIQVELLLIFQVAHHNHDISMQKLFLNSVVLRLNLSSKILSITHHDGNIMLSYVLVCGNFKVE